MCGISGIFDLREQRAFDPAVLHAMNESQFHRGPDEGDVFVAPGVALGHRRLSIIDLSSGQQPMFSSDNSLCVVYNGEIYNFQELAEELKARGHVFKTRCDTEVILYAWREWGEDCVKRFRGMFAFALYDSNQKTLFLARDRLGIKPLYYAVLPDDRLIFGSELKVLTAHPELPKRLSPEAVEEYFSLGYIPEPRSILKDASKLRAGHTLLFRRGAGVPESREYWDIPFQSDHPAEPTAIQEELVERLREAVRIRMVAEVPLGSFLSGGIDSSAVVATMSELGVKNINTFKQRNIHPHILTQATHHWKADNPIGTTHHSRSPVQWAMQVLSLNLTRAYAKHLCFHLDRCVQAHLTTESDHLPFIEGCHNIPFDSNLQVSGAKDTTVVVV